MSKPVAFSADPKEQEYEFVAWQTGALSGASREGEREVTKSRGSRSRKTITCSCRCCPPRPSSSAANEGEEMAGIERPHQEVLWGRGRMMMAVDAELGVKTQCCFQLKPAEPVGYPQQEVMATIFGGDSTSDNARRLPVVLGNEGEADTKAI